MSRGDSLVREARRVLRAEADAIAGLADRLDSRFAEAVELLRETEGRVVVSGVGKSGIIARKIAADAKARKERSERRTLDGDEDELLHENWNALDKMDDRITNLETILLERGRGADRIMK